MWGSEAGSEAGTGRRGVAGGAAAIVAGVAAAVCGCGSSSLSNTSHGQGTPFPLVVPAHRKSHNQERLWNTHPLCAADPFSSQSTCRRRASTADRPLDQPWKPVSHPVASDQSLCGR